MNLNKKPVSIGKSLARHAVKSHDRRHKIQRVAILHDSTIGKYTFRLRYKYNANGPSRICIAHALGTSKKCAEDWIKANLSFVAQLGSDLALLRFEPMNRSEFDLLFKQQEEQNDQVYSLADAA